MVAASPSIAPAISARARTTKVTPSILPRVTLVSNMAGLMEALMRPSTTAAGHTAAGAGACQ
jgi:hypothetical protein